jgi:hypothetical protein
VLKIVNEKNDEIVKESSSQYPFLFGIPEL